MKNIYNGKGPKPSKKKSKINSFIYTLIYKEVIVIKFLLSINYSHIFLCFESILIFELYRHN